MLINTMRIYQYSYNSNCIYYYVLSKYMGNSIIYYFKRTAYIK